MPKPTGPSEGPRWYVDAMARHVVRSRIDLDGTEIAYAVWPSSDPSVSMPGVLLIHGTFANHYWWSHVAGLLSPSRQVVAMDLSGHGDSGHRASYDLATWAQEVLAVLAVVEPAGRSTHVVGHSLGGVVAAVAATDPTTPIHSISMCESIRDPSSSQHPAMVPTARRVYPDRASALKRFRTIPPGLDAVPFVVDYVAARSIERVEGGWTWKHDLNVGRDLQPRMPRLDEVIVGVSCPMSVVVGQHGMVDADDLALLVASGGPTMATATIPSAAHHLMLEAPQAFAAVIEHFLDAFDGTLRDS